MDKMIELARLFGRGPGFVLFAFFVVGALLIVQSKGGNIEAWTLPLGVICTALYGGGFLKVFSDARLNYKNNPQ